MNSTLTTVPLGTLEPGATDWRSDLGSPSPAVMPESWTLIPAEEADWLTCATVFSRKSGTVVVTVGVSSVYSQTVPSFGMEEPDSGICRITVTPSPTTWDLRDLVFREFSASAVVMEVTRGTVRFSSASSFSVYRGSIPR